MMVSVNDPLLFDFLMTLEIDETTNDFSLVRIDTWNKIVQCSQGCKDVDTLKLCWWEYKMVQFIFNHFKCL